MSKTTPEEARALAIKHKLYVENFHALDALAALIDEARGVDSEPVAHQFQDLDGKWWPFMNDTHYKNTVEDGRWPIRALYTSPAPSQPAAPVELPVVGVISAYAIPTSDKPYADEILVQRSRQIEGPPLWAVRLNGDCLNKSGKWEWEPMPSSRDDEFLERCRFPTAQEAIDAAIAAGRKAS